MSTPARETAKDFWDNEYSQQEICIPSIKEPIYAAGSKYFGDVTGKRLLDIGCGKGESSLLWASQGADVVAIDYSDVAIDKLNAFCISNGITNVKGYAISAMDLEKLGQFDFVFGIYILHHIEPFDIFAGIMRNAVKPGGRGFFLENNASCGLLIWFRQNLVGKFWIPKYGDKDEFPLMPSEVNELRNKGFKVEVVYPELMLFRLFAKYLMRGFLYSWFEKLDEIMYSVDWLRKYSYNQYLKMS